MLLASPPLMWLHFVGAILAFLLFGLLFHTHKVWKEIFNLHNVEIYRKSGEYGESVLNYSMKSMYWKEPINAATSLSYSIYGLVILFTGYNDYYEVKQNILMGNPMFSFIYGFSMCYLGITSFLFHASHSELWRKRDAGMTSGVMAAPLVLAIYDRCRPIGIGDDCTYLIICCIIFQLSLTHGYLPYGSSDVVLPSLVAACFGLELLPLFGGVVSNEQYTLWIQCIIGALNGMLLRAADIHATKGNLSVCHTLLKVHVLLLIAFSWILGFNNAIIWSSFAAGLFVYKFPHLGHVFWHFGSSYSLYIWWYMYRVRPGDPTNTLSSNSIYVAFVAICFFVLIKNGVRRIFMNVPVRGSSLAIDSSTEDDRLKDRFMYTLEHAFFAYWAYTLLIEDPTSWYYNLKLCWVLPNFPTDNFHLFYLAKVATHVEDVVFAVTLYFHENESATSTSIAGSSTKSRDKVDHNIKMKIHHLCTAFLCIASYLCGYAKIGSIIMLIHDFSDLPLDFLRLSTMINSLKSLQIYLYVTTLLSWFYWRLYYFPFYVLYSIAFESKSLLSGSTAQCEVGTCTMAEVPERVPFLILLVCLQILHVIWTIEMIKKGIREFSGRR